MRINLSLNADFFDEEIRDDYCVTSNQKKIWAVELDLLNELLKVCKKYDIKVFAFAGTLLGAIRHKGFIPWDDDIDVCLDRKNYEKLLMIAHKEFKEPYFFQTSLSDREYFFGYARLRNSSTTGAISGTESMNYNNGIYIDVFVLDGYIENPYKRYVQLKMLNLVGEIASNYYWQPYHYGGRRNLVHYIMKKMCRMFFSYEKIVNFYNRIISIYTKETNRLSLMTHKYDFMNKYWCTKTDLQEVMWVPFEMIEIPIPARYDVMLTHMYGNYMDFPPIEKRGEWHVGILNFNPDVPYDEFFRNM